MPPFTIPQSFQLPYHLCYQSMCVPGARQGMSLAVPLLVCVCVSHSVGLCLFSESTCKHISLTEMVLSQTDAHPVRLEVKYT